MVFGKGVWGAGFSYDAAAAIFERPVRSRAHQTRATETLTCHISDATEGFAAGVVRPLSMGIAVVVVARWC